MDKSDEIIRESLKLFMEDLQLRISFSHSVRVHIQSIIAINKRGFSIPTIMKALEMSQSEGTFRNAIARAKKKHGITKSNNNIFTGSNEDIPTDDELKSSSLEEKCNTVQNTEYSYEQWYNAFGFELSKTYTPIAIESLLENGWNPKNYHKLKEKHNIFNNKNLIRIISNIGKHKASNKEYL